VTLLYAALRCSTLLYWGDCANGRSSHSTRTLSLALITLTLSLTLTTDPEPDPNSTPNPKYRQPREALHLRQMLVRESEAVRAPWLVRLVALEDAHQRLAGLGLRLGLAALMGVCEG